MRLNSAERGKPQNCIDIYTRHETDHRAMDDLRFRKIFNLGITKDISGKKLSKLKKIRKVWLRNVVKYGKYSPVKLANLLVI